MVKRITRKKYNCDGCDRSETSKSRGKYYASTVRLDDVFYLQLNCVNCRKSHFFNVKEVTKNKLYYY